MTPPPTTTTRARSGTAAVPGRLMRMMFRSVGRYPRGARPPGAAPLPEHKPAHRRGGPGPGPSGPEHPLVVADDFHGAPRAGTGDGHAGAADHDVGVHRRAVEPDLQPLLVAHRRAARDRERKTLPPGNVAARVLVEQRVVEEDAGLSDPRITVHERDLAEAP